MDLTATLMHDIFLISILAIMLCVFYIFLKIKCRNKEDKVLEMFNKQLEHLYFLKNKDSISHTRKTIKMHSVIQNLLKISDGDNISVFKYSFVKKIPLINFISSVNKDGEILNESYLDKLPVTSNILTLKIMNSPVDKLSKFDYKKLRKTDEKIYQMLKYRGVNSLFYKNIKGSSGTPIGYINIGYMKSDVVISDRNEKEILRIIESIVEYI